MIYLAALCVAAGVLLATSAAVSRRGRQVADLRGALELQTLAAPDPRAAEETSKLLARSGLLAERVLGQDGGILGRMTDKLERSDWSLAPGEFFVVTLVAGLIGAILGFSLDGPGTALPFALVAGAVPYVLVAHSVERRRRHFEDQFPGVLDLLAASLEAGSTLPQALELVAAEADAPAKDEFGRVLANTRLGATLTEALDTASQRIGSRDMDWTVQAIAVQQRTGGRLAEILRVVAGTMRDRAEVRRELQALTAEGKLSAYILIGLPFLLAGFISIADPHYLGLLFHTVFGLVLLIGASVLMAVATVVMFRVIRVEV